MIVESIHIKGFRCFDSDGQRIELRELTCLVGPNASGKTATMAALARVFGETQRQRTLDPADFHLDTGEELRNKDERKLSIEIRIAFPELNDPNDAAGTASGIPESWNQMIVDQPGATPYCRVRLEGMWLNDGTPSGEVQQQLWWILTNSTDPALEEEHRRRVKPAERAHIRVIYVPATRDPTAQIRGTATSVFGRLLKALEWAGKDKDLRTHLKTLNAELAGLTGIGVLNELVQESWKGVYDGRVAAKVSFEPMETEPEALLRMLAPTFAPNEAGQQIYTDNLSDGLRSLFAISLPIGLLGVEERLRSAAAENGFKASVVDGLPLLTLFALEEPENHLSPHYLGRVVRRLYDLATKPSAQVVLSSHAPSLLRRVEPDDVRYYLGGEARAVSEVRPLSLPTCSDDEAFKYVREAIRGYPELYFSRLVILGEGPSEEIVLRRLFEAAETPLDSLFISVVPLGGRHVNHFWRLLTDLGIPYITLIDLDREKAGAGWGRIKYVRDQLVKLHGAAAEELTFKQEDGSEATLADPALDELGKRCPRTDVSGLNAWIDFLQRTFGVYFSAPLDLDFAMLGAFPEAYREQAPTNGGPRIPEDEPTRSEEVDRRLKMVLASNVKTAPDDLGSSYTDDEKERFAWYKYLFVDGSKPVAHMRALVALDGTNWVENLPAPLNSLLEHARQLAGVIKDGDSQ